MRVYLVRKLAEKIDGVDLSAHDVGDVLDLSPSEARLIVAEGWGIPGRRAADRGERRGYSGASVATLPARKKTVGTNGASLFVQASTPAKPGVAADTSARPHKPGPTDTAAVR